MPEKIGEYYYTISADNKLLLNELNSTEKSIEGFSKNAALAAGGIVTAFLAVGKVLSLASESIREAADAAKQTAVLNNSLKNIGLKYSDIRDDVQAIAEANAFDDDQIKQIYNYGIAVGVPAEKLKQFAQTSVDYAAQSGKGLEFAMRTVATAAKDTGDKFDQLSKATAGAGAELADADGGLTRLNVANKQLQETIGALILNSMQPFNAYLKSVVDYFTQWLQKIDEANQKAKELKITQSNPGYIAQLKEYNKLYKEQNAELEKQLGNKAKENALYQQNLEEIRLNEEAIKKYEVQLKAVNKEQQKSVENTQQQASNYYDITAEIDRIKESMAQYGETLNMSTKDTEELQNATIEMAQVFEAFMQVSSKLTDTIVNLSGAAGESADNLKKGINTAINFIGALARGDVISAASQAVGVILDTINQAINAEKKLKEEMAEAAEEARLQKIKDDADKFANSLNAITKIQGIINKLTEENTEQWKEFTKIQAAIEITKLQQALDGLKKSFEGAAAISKFLPLQQSIMIDPVLDENPIAKRNARIVEIIELLKSGTKDINLLIELQKVLDDKTLSTAQSDAILKIIDYYGEILDVNAQLAQLEDNKTEAIIDQNTALEKQKGLYSQIDDLIQAGAIDAENINSAQRITAALARDGLSPNEILSAVNSIGLTGANSTSNIGAINIEVNEASGQTLDSAVNAQLASIFGR